MSLPKSLLTTTLIFGVVWAALIWKNASAINDSTALSASSVANISATSEPLAALSTDSNAVITLIGIQNTVSLAKGMDDVNQQWQDFYDHSDLHRAVTGNMSGKVYGYYRALDNNFENAELTIGYNSHKQTINRFEILENVTFDQFETVMENSKSWDTTPAWDAIDQKRAVVAVLEEYVMSSGGNVTSTNVYVLYK